MFAENFKTFESRRVRRRSAPPVRASSVDIGDHVIAYEPVIGLEIHAQLLTASKIFCGCSTAFGAPPNTHVCPVCLGLPGRAAGPQPGGGRSRRPRGARARLPHQRDVDLRAQELLLSRPAEGLSDLAVRTAARERAARSSSRPAAGPRRVGITRVHLEEDAGKSLHEGFPDSDRKTYVDYNRSGTPLIEIVTEPDLRSAADAAEFFAGCARFSSGSASTTATWKRAACAATRTSRSVRRAPTTLGTKAEVKNLNSFRFLQKALEYEIERQIDVAGRAAAASCRKRGSGTPRRASPSRCAARKKRTTTGTFPSPICRRVVGRRAARRRRSARRCPSCPMRAAGASSRRSVCPSTTPRS